jgi:hypothetical protein
MPGGQLPLVPADLPATLLPPPLVQADVAEKQSTMVAQMPIAAGTLVMMLASPLLQQPQRQRQRRTACAQVFLNDQKFHLTRRCDCISAGVAGGPRLC